MRRSIKLLLIAVISFLLLATVFVLSPKSLQYTIEDQIAHWQAPDFHRDLDTFSDIPQKIIIQEYRNKGFDLSCYGNLAAREKIGKHNDYLCWAPVNTAYGNVPAKLVTFFFYQKKLIHVRMSFPYPAYDKLHQYLDKKYRLYPRLDKKPGAHFGKDPLGLPLMAWGTRDGIITTSKGKVSGHEHVVLWSSKKAFELKAKEKNQPMQPSG